MRTQWEKTGILTLGLAALAFDKAKEVGTKLAHTAEEKYNDRERIMDDLNMQVKNLKTEMSNKMTEEMQKLRDKWNLGHAEA